MDLSLKDALSLKEEWDELNSFFGGSVGLKFKAQPIIDYVGKYHQMEDEYYKLQEENEKLKAEVEKLTPAPKKMPSSGWQRKAKQESEKLKAKEVERKMKIAPKKVPPYENDLEEQLYEVANKIQCEDTFGPLLKSCAKQKKSIPKKVEEGVPPELYPEVSVCKYTDKDLMEIYGKIGVKVLYDILMDMPCGDTSRSTKVQKIRRIIEYGGAKELRYQVIKKVGHSDSRADSLANFSNISL